jgi:hypothetical protein
MRVSVSVEWKRLMDPLTNKNAFLLTDIEQALVNQFCGIGNIHATVGCAPPDDMRPARARFPV